MRGFPREKLGTNLKQKEKGMRMDGRMDHSFLVVLAHKSDDSTEGQQRDRGRGEECTKVCTSQFSVSIIREFRLPYCFCFFFKERNRYER